MILDDIATYLANSSTAFTILAGTSGNLGKQILLDNDHYPDTVVSLYETPGSPNAYTYSTSTGGASVAWERPSLQIISRSTVYTTARTNAQTAYVLLDGLAGRNLPTATGTTYLDITAAQPPFSLGRDENERFLVSTNYNVWKAVS